MTSVEHIRARIVELIAKHDENKRESVDMLMKKFKAKENDLLKQLCEKYNEQYVKMKPLSIKRVYSIASRFPLSSSKNYYRRKCKRRKDGVIFELKIINKKELTKHKLLKLESEINIMRQISHENIVKLHDIFDSRAKMCLIIDLMEGGELFNRIIQQQHFSEKTAAMIFKQICKALQYIHSLSIVHNHLKPENLLFVTKANDSKIKLIDFSFARLCKNGDLSASVIRYESDYDYYVSPETLKASTYNIKSDMWSAGVILYIILCGFPPFYHETSTNYDEYLTFGFIRESQKLLSYQTNLFYIIPRSIIFLCLQFCGYCCDGYIEYKLYNKIKCAQYCMPSPFWDDISENAKDLIMKLLQSDPSKRLNACDVLQHKWLKGATSDKALGCYHRLHLKRFQYIYRLRRGIKCILAVLRMIEVLKS